MEQKKDMLEKGAIVQRDKETFAIAPHIPGGITNAETLRKLADVAERYGAKAIKVTSAQRIALVGIEESQLDEAWEQLGMDKGAAIGLCVRSVKICPGTTFCKRGQQDAVAVGLELDRLYHGMETPSKMKIGVSGCANSCAETAVKDIGLMGKPGGFTVMVGGSAGVIPRLADVIYTDVQAENVVSLVDKIIVAYKELAKGKERLSKMIGRIGSEAFKNYLEADAAGREAIKNKLA